MGTVATITNPPGHGHPTHSMVLDCILVNVSINSSGQKILSNHAFRFKNTDRNQKQIEIPLNSPRSPLEFYYIFIDFVPPIPYPSDIESEINERFEDLKNRLEKM